MSGHSIDPLTQQKEGVLPFYSRPAYSMCFYPSLYSNDLLKYINFVMLFIKKKYIQFVYKKIFRDITKLKLLQKKCNQKLRKDNQLYF